MAIVAPLLAFLTLLGLLQALAPGPASSRPAETGLQRPCRSGLGQDCGTFAAARAAANAAFPATGAAWAAQAQEPSSLTLAEYWRKVQETLTLVESAGDVPLEVRRILLGAAAEGWQQVRTVVLADGTAMMVDHSFLAALLTADPPNLGQIEHLLSTLLASRATWPRPAWALADLATLDSILASAEFQWPAEEPSALAQWWQRAMEWLSRVLLRPLAEGWALTPAVRYTLTALGVVAVAIALWYALRGVFSGLVKEEKLEPEETAAEDLTVAAALKRAEVLAGAGDYRAAVRYLYLSSLLVLEEKGLLRYDRSLTNREYLRSVGALPDLAAALRRVIEVFERVWYGYQPLAALDYSQYADWVADLRRLR